jgi:hypothetical protein
MDASDLAGFGNSRRNFIGGTYGSLCVYTAAEEISKFAPPFSIRPIRDAIVSYNPSIYDMIMSTTSGRILRSGSKVA